VEGGNPKEEGEPKWVRKQKEEQRSGLSSPREISLYEKSNLSSYLKERGLDASCAKIAFREVSLGVCSETRWDRETAKPDDQYFRITE